jgi:hypothetical protein
LSSSHAGKKASRHKGTLQVNLEEALEEDEEGLGADDLPLLSFRRFCWKSELSLT